jgi:hypothetical protein
MKSHAPQQGNIQSNELEVPNFQGVNSLDMSQQQMSQGQGGIHPQADEHYGDMDGLMGNGMSMGRSPNDDRHFPHWSRDLTDLWTFPGGEFGFDDMAFMQQF